MKDSYLTAGIKLGKLLSLLRRNKITYSPTNVLRLIFLFQSSLWSSFFAWIETVKYARALKNAPDSEDPVFIIGHWRTGTTFLHQLMSLDDNMTAPTLFQVAVPDSFLVSYPYYRPIFKRFVSGHRPMDQVKIGMDEPQEDEYALFRLTTFSPLENLVFPKSDAYFLNHGSPFLPVGNQLEEWKKTVRYFFKKLSYHGQKRVVSKNPFNSFRIRPLLEIFPNARFINMVRNPYDVVPSSIHLWKILRNQNTMNSMCGTPNITEVTAMLKNIQETIEKEALNLPKGTMIRVKFEDLEKSPVTVLKGVYDTLGLPFNEKLEGRINEFMIKNQPYKKNTFSLTDEEKMLISIEMKDLMQTFGYDQQTGTK